MADKAITDLIEASQLTKGDWFLLEQGGTAKKLSGQTLIAFLTALADGHGGISGIEKTATEGLRDHYAITFADGSKFSYTVTNGEKGDKGDNAYVWIKYASQEPTAGSHSMGDMPDKWMGVYAGNAAAAPTNWEQYKWFEIKGEKGDTGAPATVEESSVVYQVGTSGTEIPTGEWTADVLVAPQGSYLWSKTITRFNTGEPLIVYAVSRTGRDGLGTLRTINGIEADENGNVTISAVSVGAIAKTGDKLEGMLDANGNRVTGIPYPTEEQDAVPYGLFQNSEEVVWTNKAPGSEFATQVLTMKNSIQGNRLVISFAVEEDREIHVQTTELTVDRIYSEYSSVIMAPLENGNIVRRRFHIAGTKDTIMVNFGNAYDGVTPDNGKLIPQYILVSRRVT